MWLVACDETGVDGARYYGFGSLWLAYERRGDLTGQLGALRRRHGFHDELKWKKANTVKYHQFMLDVVDWFFRRKWMAFHCLLVEKALVDKAAHGGSYDLARRKHFTMLLTNKMKRCVQTHPRKDHAFRVWVDPIASSYPKADEAVEIISGNVLKQKLKGKNVDVRVSTLVSHDTEAIQVCDLLLGACAAAWQGKATSKGKVGIQQAIASHLGWTDLAADTFRDARKFNIWMFLDPVRQRRKVASRPLNLRYPQVTSG